jgi:hypothetical protein
MAQPINNWQISGSNPVTVGGTGTTAKYFPAPSGNFTAGASIAPSSTNASGQLAVPGRSILNGQSFDIIATGNYEVGSGGACPNVLIEVVANTGTITSPTYTVIMTSGQVTAQNLTGTWYDWNFIATVNGTTQSGLLTGLYTAVVDGSVVRNNVALTNTLTGLAYGPTAAQNQSSNQTTTDPVFGLLVRVTFSVSEPGNSANMYQFGIY